MKVIAKGLWSDEYGLEEDVNLEIPSCDDIDSIKEWLKEYYRDSDIGCHCDGVVLNVYGDGKFLFSCRVDSDVEFGINEIV